MFNWYPCDPGNEVRKEPIDYNKLDDLASNLDFYHNQFNHQVQADQFNMALFLWHLVKSYFSIEHVYSNVY